MKILIGHAYLNGYGGGERFVLEQANYLSKKHDVRIVTWEYLPEKTFKGFSKHNITELKSGRFSISKFVKWSMRKENFDVCSTHGFPSNFLAMRNKNTIWYCHRPDLPFQESANPYYSILRTFDRSAIKRTKKLVTNSQFSRGMLKKYYNRDSEVVNPGIDTSEFRPGKVGDYVLLVSRISPEKNIQLAIDAMDLVPEIKMKIVAGWVNKKYYGKLRMDRKRVEILGNVPDSELKRLYSNCLCVMQTAVNESFGMVPLEGMASGKPIIATNRAGFVETITEKTGFLLEPDPMQFADKIKYLHKNRPVATKMGKAGLKRAKDFSWDKKMKEMSKVLGL
jgi:glycosyltransferase involved in cell wall biosynthesis